MYAMIDSSGCEIIDGNIKLKISMYLEPGDARYDEHYVEVVDTESPEFLVGYQGEVDAEGFPIDEGAYNAWFEALPKKWQLNPFHNHFIRIDDGVITLDVINEVKAHLTNFYVAWANEQDIRTGWINRIKPTKKNLPPGQLRKYQARLDALLNETVEYKIRL